MMHAYREQIEELVLRLASTPERLARAVARKTLEQLEKRPAAEIFAP